MQDDFLEEVEEILRKFDKSYKTGSFYGALQYSIYSCTLKICRSLTDLGGFLGSIIQIL